MKTMTIEEGIAIQQDQLKDFVYILNARAYLALVDVCILRNSALNPAIHSGFHVFRGVSLDSFVKNWAYDQRTKDEQQKVKGDV